MKQKKTTESSQTTTPTAAPDLQFALDQNKNLFNTLMGRTEGVAGFNPYQNTAFGLGAARALGGSPLIDAAQGAATGIAQSGYLPQGASDYYASLAGGGVNNPAIDYYTATARGDYLDPTTNPAFAQGLDAISNSVGSIFERSGRTGSGANQAAVTRGASGLWSDIYNAERGNQLNAAGALGNLYNSDVTNAFNAGGMIGNNAQAQLSAAGMAPGLAEADYRDINALMNIGNIQQGQSQAEMDFPYNNAILAQQLLNSGVGGLGPLLGGTQTGKTTETSSPGLFNSIMGGLMTAAPLVSGMFGGAGATGGGSMPSGMSYALQSPSSGISQGAIGSGWNPYAFSPAGI